MDQHARCVDCGESRPSQSQVEEGSEQEEYETLEALESLEAPPPEAWARWQQGKPPEPGFVGRSLRRTLFHYRRVLGPFLPGLLLVVLPIQVGYLHIARVVMEGKATGWPTLAVSAVLTVLVTLASYYIIILTAFSIRNQDVALGPFYSQLPWDIIRTLWVVTVLYGLSIFFGFLLLVVPGLVALTLFCLLQPFVVLEGASVAEAFRAGPRLVIGRGGTQALQVFSVIVMMELALTATSFLVLSPLATLATRLASPALAQVFDVAVGGILFPLHAVVLTVIYDELVGIPRPEESQ
jgi:hypothetical protein